MLLELSRSIYKQKIIKENEKSKIMKPLNLEIIFTIESNNAKNI